MNLERSLLEEFKKYIESQYGGSFIIDDKIKGELGRCMVNDKILILRDHFPRRSEDAIEVFCSDKVLLDKIEKEFLMGLSQMAFLYDTKI